VPAGSLLALLDDIASNLDDVAAMTKVATKKTAGVLGDDLALNAEQVSGVSPERELPVVWAVAKGSTVNKVILVPAALAISALAPWAITPLLMAGGTYLCFEGFEKVAHAVLHRRGDAKSEATDAAPAKSEATADPKESAEARERRRVKGAIRTDFVLSAEIIVIALGTVATAPLRERLLVLCAIAALVTVGVYGLVAGIVKLDDLGLALRRRTSSAARAIGGGILRAAPYMMKTLSVVGTIAMFLVGGGIVVHGIPGLHQRIEQWKEHAGPVGGLLPTALDGVGGILVGAVAVLIVGLGKRLVTRGA
jgi:predicted DNA repair protein MutK